MTDVEQPAIEAALFWNEEGFNKRDRNISVDLMHFPHVRLWNNQFSIFNSELLGAKSSYFSFNLSTK